MIDYVARALAQKALASSGGGGTINTYSKDEINALLEENKQDITNEVLAEVNTTVKDDIVNTVTSEVTETVKTELENTVITEDYVFVVVGGTVEE